MAKVFNVWPSAGTTVPLSGGAVIGAGGAVLTLETAEALDEVVGLVRCARLLTYDPLDESDLIPDAILTPSFTRANEATNLQGFGLNGDGIADDSAVVQAAIAASVDGSLVAENETIALSSRMLFTKPVSFRGSGRGTVLRLTAGAYPGNAGNLVANTDLANPITVVGAISQGQKQLTLSSTAGLAAGDNMYLMLGDDPYDVNECLVRMFNVVQSVDSSTLVTFRLPIPESMGVPVNLGSNGHKAYKPSPIVENVTYENMSLERTSLQDQAAVFSYVRNVAVRNVYASANNGGMVFNGVENGVLENVYFLRSSRLPHIASGRIFTGVGNRCVSVRNLYALDVDGFGIFLESQNRFISFENIFLGSGPGADTGSASIHVVGGSTGVTFKNVHINSEVSRIALNIGQAADVRTEDFYLWSTTKYFPLKQHSGRLFYKDTLYTHKRTWKGTWRIPNNSNYGQLDLPTGMIAQIRATASTGTGVLDCYVQSGDFNSIQWAAPFNAPGTAAVLDGGIGTNVTWNTQDAHQFVWHTNTSVPAGATFSLEVDYFTRDATAAPEAPADLLRTSALELGLRNITSGSAAPVSGSAKLGDIVYNSSPTSGGFVGWVCTAAGSPGTWKTFGVIS